MAGNKTYGSRKALVDRREWEGPSYRTCRNAASVAEKFEVSVAGTISGLPITARWLLFAPKKLIMDAAVPSPHSITSSA